MRVSKLGQMKPASQLHSIPESPTLAELWSITHPEKPLVLPAGKSSKESSKA